MDKTSQTYSIPGDFSWLNFTYLLYLRTTGPCPGPQAEEEVRPPRPDEEDESPRL